MTPQVTLTSPMLVQPVLVFEASGPKLTTVHNRALTRGLEFAIYTAGSPQVRAWLMDALFTDQGRIDDPHLWDRCERLGLDVGRFESDRRSEGVARRVARDLRDGMRAGVTNTPALLRLSVD